jgi:cobalt-zinc-cadmium efflux system protein
MAHYRPTIGAATFLNGAISVGEGRVAFFSGSLSLLVDSVHNLADELAFVCLYLAFFLPGYLGRQSRRTANVLASAGLIGRPRVGSDPAVASSGRRPGFRADDRGHRCRGGQRARLLRDPARQSGAVRLAYLHNWGGVGVSLTPAAAGVLVMTTRRPIFDSVIALAVALWLILSTIRELRVSSGEIL